MLLSSIVVLVCLSSVSLMVGVVVLLVLIASIVVFARTKNYGEAALALVAGLLTAFTVDWTAGRFITFVVAWLAFSFLAIMISSVRLAANLESIYTHAAVSLSHDPAEITRLTKELQAIGNKGTPYHQLLPIVRAEAIRLLVFRKIPIEDLSEALKAIEVVSTVTRVDPQVVTLFIADVLKILRVRTSSRYQVTLDQVLSIIRESAVPPEDYIKAFQQSRRLALSHAIRPDIYFQRISDCLEDGVAPEDMSEAISDRRGA